MSPVECNELSFAVLERELHIDRIMSAKQSLDLTDVESRIWLNYLDQICELFRGEIPHIKHPKMDFSDLRQKYRINHTHAQPDFSKLLAMKPKAKSPMQDAVDVPTTVQRRSVLEEERQAAASARAAPQRWRRGRGKRRRSCRERKRNGSHYSGSVEDYYLTS